MRTPRKNRSSVGGPPSPASGVDESVLPVLPVFGLDLPRLPSPERTRREQQFMFEGLASFPRREISWADVRDAAQAALRNFDDRKTFEDAPLKAVRTLGLAALRPSRLEDLPAWQPRPGSTRAIDEILRDLHRVRGLVWAGVERWRELARWHASQEGRRSALRRLREFGRMLVPDTRGKRKDIGPPPEVLLLGYRQLLFRLGLARELLNEADPKGRVSITDIQEVSRECGLPEEWIRDWLFFADRWERKARVLTAEQMARDLLGRIAGMDPDSIAAMISRGRRGQSRKGAAS